MTHKPALWLLGLLLLPNAARGQPERAGSGASPGVIVAVEGIGGVDVLPTSLPVACRKAGLPHEVRRFTWTHGTGKFFKDLQDTQHLLRKAQELASYLRTLRDLYPDRPIHLVARSAGTGLTLFALEALPPDTVDRVILLSAAVSPTYDLRPALRASRLGIISFHSPHDQIILNWGTRHFGTADRYYGPSAGLKGFEVPQGLDDEGRQLYARLVQVSWHSGMLWHGHSGGHLGTAAPAFLAQEVAPWLR
jgi:pimeloyl-ACP methyl ester carboxylesterase